MIKAMDIKSREVTLSWSQPLEPNNSPLLSFVIEYTQANGKNRQIIVIIMLNIDLHSMCVVSCRLSILTTSLGSWSQGYESVSVPPTDDSVIISGLLPNMQYKMRVLATNSLGKSSPSQELTIRTEEEGWFTSNVATL